MNPDLTIPQQWKPVILTGPSTLTNGPGERSAQALHNVIAQFFPATNPRYTRTPTATFCNIFLWDVTRALGCEIPHWITEADGPHEESANMTVDWLSTLGKSHGWAEVGSPLVARSRASLGLPTCVVWKNPSGRSGHVAIVLPPHEGDAPAELRIAQAGGRNFFDEPLEHGFGALPVRFFTHD